MSSANLAYPKWDLPFILQVDATNFGMGGILTQIHPKSGEHPVAYFSRKFSTSEKNYAIMERVLSDG